MILRCLLILCAAAAVAACSGNGCRVPAEQMPPLLSQTLCVNMADPAQPAAGTIPYDINEAFWSDGAEKWRYLSLPAGARIDIAGDGDFRLPAGSVLIKNFRLQGRFIETRLFMRKIDGGWQGYSYQWNDTQTDAQLLSHADEISIGGQVWHYPGRDECMQCHTEAAGFSLGLEVAQLNKDDSHARRGGWLSGTGNQIDRLRALGLLADVPEPSVRDLKLVSSRDFAQDLNRRARAYLHSNCSQCHRPGGGTDSNMDLRAATPLADMHVCDTRPQLGELGIPDARLLAPGDYARSVIWSRMKHQDNNRMPLPRFSKVPDAEGVRLIEEWIGSLPGCG
ncbi:MAG TPA: hypothetical protein VFX02_10835 [Gammaproteobacteria bacterium]|nr:hypothetical protein [Gammaproteobacteria bacterium]